MDDNKNQVYIEVPESLVHQFITEEDLITTATSTSTIFEANEHVELFLREREREERKMKIRYRRRSPFFLTLFSRLVFVYKYAVFTKKKKSRIDVFDGCFSGSGGSLLLLYIYNYGED